MTVEAEPKNAELLRLNLEGLDQVYPFWGIFSYREGAVQIVRNKSNTGGHLTTSYCASGWDPDMYEATRVSVPTISLEKLMKMYHMDRVSILKMDCEGCEFNFFENVSSEAFGKIDRIVGEYHETLEGFKRRVYERLNESFDVVDIVSHPHTPYAGTFYAVNKQIGLHEPID